MSDDQTMDRNDGTPLPAEYVLGLLSAAERRDFETRLASEPALVRGHAAWALGCLGGPEARAALAARAAVEPDLWVQKEIGLALDALPA